MGIVRAGVTCRTLIFLLTERTESGHADTARSAESAKRRWLRGAAGSRESKRRALCGTSQWSFSCDAHTHAHTHAHARGHGHVGGTWQQRRAAGAALRCAALRRAVPRRAVHMHMLCSGALRRAAMRRVGAPSFRRTHAQSPRCTTARPRSRWRRRCAGRPRAGAAAGRPRRVRGGRMRDATKPPEARVAAASPGRSESRRACPCPTRPLRARPAAGRALCHHTFDREFSRRRRRTRERATWDGQHQASSSGNQAIKQPSNQATKQPCTIKQSGNLGWAASGIRSEAFFRQGVDRVARGESV